MWQCLLVRQIAFTDNELLIPHRGHAVAVHARNHASHATRKSLPEHHHRNMLRNLLRFEVLAQVSADTSGWYETAFHVAIGALAI